MSSICGYRRENGRPYRQCRVDILQPHLFLLAFDNSLGFAPPNSRDAKDQRVFDLAVGSGVWAGDYASEHHDAQVIGTDLSLNLPSFNVVDDSDEGLINWLPFDYIPSWMPNFSTRNWSDYLRFFLRECSVFASSDDGTLKEDSDLSNCLKLLQEASIKADIMLDAGFVDVVEKLRDLGLRNNENMSTGLESSTKEVAAFLGKVKRDLDDPGIHAYWPVCSIYGKKPEDDLKDRV
ncbi:hypothetical protein B0J13DRAFT_586724 [Dactylonectria estremocensis]|uniref:Methyltransferase domain-containing protein n=1 Tax=Dactylonectria estremocensis TaxID=1079267 RepID=A0A9P9IYZ0_9HYPO|nr:hypothetical protein B0J13DRAFT_586724 [Dactylonectria estremocensis]